MRLQEYDTSERFQATLVKSTRITPPESDDDIRELVLEIDRRGFKYELGQSIGVLVAGPHAFGHEHHFRLYTVADILDATPDEKPRIDICVKRCHYIDEYSGEEYQGIASNYLCDLQPGQHLTLTGPYGLPFEIPTDKTTNLLMIGVGTGIAPFRAFVKHIYKSLGGWEGKVRLFYGARTGLDMIYMNDERDDFTQYYDEDTFEAFKAMSPRPHWDEPPALDAALAQHEKEVWDMLCHHNTFVYIAGLENVRGVLAKAFSSMAGSQEKWERRKAELIAGGRWAELIYP